MNNKPVLNKKKPKDYEHSFSAFENSFFCLISLSGSHYLSLSPLSLPQFGFFCLFLIVCFDMTVLAMTVNTSFLEIFS